MYPHRIRLRGPWTCQPLFHYRVLPDGTVERSTDDLPPVFRMTMPGRWMDGGLLEFRGGVRCLRPFGYPGRIDDFERVWLTLAGLEERATVQLNEQVLGAIAAGGEAAEFEITRLLQPRNTLTVDVESMSPAGGLWGEVALEVRATAFLRGVRFALSDDGRVNAQGLAVGHAARPLELYLFAGDRFLTYQRVEPTAQGQPFTLSGAVNGATLPLPVRLELVDAATIWYVVQGIVDLSQTNP
jgi:hypothetical protein